MVVLTSALSNVINGDGIMTVILEVGVDAAAENRRTSLQNRYVVSDRFRIVCIMAKFIVSDMRNNGGSAERLFLSFGPVSEMSVVDWLCSVSRF